jgi:hypothetical protein
MADKKKDPKAAATAAGDAKPSLKKAALGLFVTEYTRPLLKAVFSSLSPEVKGVIRKLGLPTLSKIGALTFNSVFPSDNYWWGDAVNELANEFSSEFATAANENKQKAVSQNTPTAAGFNPNLYAAFLSTQLIGGIAGRTEAFGKLYLNADGSEKNEKEKAAITGLINQLNIEQFLGLLTLPQAERDQFIAQFVQKTKEEKAKTLAEVIADFQAQLPQIAVDVKAAYSFIKPLLDAPAGKLADKVDAKISAPLEKRATQRDARPWWQKLLW